MYVCLWPITSRIWGVTPTDHSFNGFATASRATPSYSEQPHHQLQGTSSDCPASSLAHQLVYLLHARVDAPTEDWSFLHANNGPTGPLLLHGYQRSLSTCCCISPTHTTSCSSPLSAAQSIPACPSDQAPLLVQRLRPASLSAALGSCTPSCTHCSRPMQPNNMSLPCFFGKSTSCQF